MSNELKPGELQEAIELATDYLDETLSKDATRFQEALKVLLAAAESVAMLDWIERQPFIFVYISPWGKPCVDWKQRQDDPWKHATAPTLKEAIAKAIEHSRRDSTDSTDAPANPTNALPRTE